MPRGFQVGSAGSQVGPAGGQVGPFIGGPPITAFQRQPKTYIVKVYDPTGATLLATWWDVANFPEYDWPINGGMGTLTLRLPRPYGSTGEKGEPNSDNSIEFGNQVLTYIVDYEAPNGQLRHQGVIDEWSIGLDGQVVEIKVIPRTSEISDGAIVSDIQVNGDITGLFHTLATQLPGITWDASSPPVGHSLSLYVLKAPLKYKQIFDFFQQYAGGNWYYRLNIDNSMTFNYWSIEAPPTHKLVVGREVSSNVIYKSSRMNYYKRVIVTGSQPLTTVDAYGVAQTVQSPFNVVVADPDYDPTLEVRDLMYGNSRIGDYATAYRIGYGLKEFHNQPFYETQVTVVDSNVDPTRGYDIEAFRPGDMVQLTNPDQVYQLPVWGDGSLWGDGDLWGGPRAAQSQRSLVIANVHYAFDHVVLTMRNRSDNVPAAIVEIENRLQIVGA